MLNQSTILAVMATLLMYASTMVQAASPQDIGLPSSDEVKSALMDLDLQGVLQSIHGDTLYVVVACMVLVGLLFCFLGWRLWGFLVFLAGFIVGSTLGLYVVLQIFEYGWDTETEWMKWATLATSLAVGLLVGCLAVCFINFGFFVAGAAAGASLAVFLDNILTQEVAGYPNWVIWPMMVFFVLLLGVLAVQIGKTLIIIGTAVAGGVTIMHGLYLLPQLQQHGLSIWVYAVGAVVLAIVGMAVQFKLFGNHENQKYSKKQQYRPAGAESALVSVNVQK